MSKDDAYDEVLHMLVENTQEAVERYKDSIPAAYMDFEHKDSPVLSLRKLDGKDRDKGLDMIAVSANGRLSRLRIWAGKTLSLFECSRQPVRNPPYDAMFSS